MTCSQVNNFPFTEHKAEHIHGQHIFFQKQNPTVEPLCLVEFLSKNYTFCEFYRRRKDEKDKHDGVTGEWFSCLTHGET